MTLKDIYKMIYSVKVEKYIMMKTVILHILYIKLPN